MRRRKTGLRSGNPVCIENGAETAMDISVISYNRESAQIHNIADISELAQYRDNSDIAWINISGLNNTGSIKYLGEMFNIHPLSIEDVLNTVQQPKIEVFSDYRFLSVKTIQREKNFHHDCREKQKKAPLFFGKKKDSPEDLEEFLIDQVSIIIMENTLITFQEIPGDSFDGIRKNILNGTGQIRSMGTDYLAYAIIDAVVDEYFLALDHLEWDIENFEDRATKTSDGTFIEEIQDTKKYLLHIKRAVLPLKDNVAIIYRQDTFFLTDELKPFVRDLLDNLNNTIITVETYREWLSGIMDANLSVVSYQMNKVMKVLAVISTIFIPLTFIAGIYGMNFAVMPELTYTLGYPIVLGVMGLTAAIMIIIFKIHRWF
jgi:magnesium transporter